MDLGPAVCQGGGVRQQDWGEEEEEGKGNGKGRGKGLRGGNESKRNRGRRKGLQRGKHSPAPLNQVSFQQWLFCHFQVY